MCKLLRHILFISVLLVLASGCNKGGDDSGALVYMWFDVDGQVINQAGSPIEGITVTAESAEPVKTDKDGIFSIRGGGLPASSAAIRCVDDDKEVNGSYSTKTVMVELVKYKDGEGWAEGYYRNKEEVVIRLSEESVITPSIPGVEATQGAGR